MRKFWRKSCIALMLSSVMVSSANSLVEVRAEEGKVINIYSWNTEFRDRVVAVYSKVESTSDDGTITTLKDGTEIHWNINPNQDGVYQQKLDEALLKQMDATGDDLVDIFLTETDYVNKYVDEVVDVTIPLVDLGIDIEKDLADQFEFSKTTPSDQPPHGLSEGPGAHSGVGDVVGAEGVSWSIRGHGGRVRRFGGGLGG